MNTVEELPLVKGPPLPAFPLRSLSSPQPCFSAASAPMVTRILPP